MEANRIAPNYEEMAAALGLKSKANIFRLLDALQERGFVKRIPNRARAIMRTNPREENPHMVGIHFANQQIETAYEAGYQAGRDGKPADPEPWTFRATSRVARIGGAVSSLSLPPRGTDEKAAPPSPFKLPK